jgi:hypothetical protein
MFVDVLQMDQDVLVTSKHRYLHSLLTVVTGVSSVNTDTVLASTELAMVIISTRVKEHARL